MLPELYPKNNNKNTHTHNISIKWVKKENQTRYHLTLNMHVGQHGNVSMLPKLYQKTTTKHANRQHINQVGQKGKPDTITSKTTRARRTPWERVLASTALPKNNNNKIRAQTQHIDQVGQKGKPDTITSNTKRARGTCPCFHSSTVH